MGNRLPSNKTNATKGPPPLPDFQLGNHYSKAMPYDIVVDINHIPKEAKDSWPVILSLDLQNALLQQIEKEEHPAFTIEEELAKLTEMLKREKNGENLEILLQKKEELNEELKKAQKNLTEQLLKMLKLDEECPIVAVLGLFNRGKTHILNKIANITLPSGKKVHTRGISFKKPNHFNFILVDTAGSSSPMDREWKKRFKESSNAITEKKTLELLIQEMTFSLVDQIIVVVNELTWPDQEYIQILQKKLADSNKKTPLIVIHNFSDVEDEGELLEMWKASVLNTVIGDPITVTTESGPITYFKEDVPDFNNNESSPTEHYFLARDGSEAGEKYNPRTYQALTKKFQYFTVPSKLPIIRQLEVSVISALQIFTTKPESLEWNFNKDYRINPLTEPKKCVLDEDWSKIPPISSDNQSGHFSLKVKGNIEMTHVANFNGFQFQLVQTESEFKPPYDVILGPDYFTVAVDLCGIPNDRISIKVEIPQHINQTGKTCIEITGTRTLYTLTHARTEGPLKTSPVKYDDFADKYALSKGTTKPRTGGMFKIIVELPDKVSRFEREAVTVRNDGVLYYSLPMIKVDKVVKIKNVEFDF